MTEHWPKSVEEVTKRLYCDVCKEGTPHKETTPNTWRCTVCIARLAKPSAAKAKSLQENTIDFGDYTADARHWAALDGMGNRGEPPPPIQLRNPKGKRE